MGETSIYIYGLRMLHIFPPHVRPLIAFGIIHNGPHFSHLWLKLILCARLLALLAQLLLAGWDIHASILAARVWRLLDLDVLAIQDPYGIEFHGQLFSFIRWAREGNLNTFTRTHTLWEWHVRWLSCLPYSWTRGSGIRPPVARGLRFSDILKPWSRDARVLVPGPLMAGLILPRISSKSSGGILM